MKYSSIAVLALLGKVSASRHHHHGRDLLEVRHIDEWDPSHNKFMDADSYVKDVRTAIDLGESDEALAQKMIKSHQQ